MMQQLSSVKYANERCWTIALVYNTQICTYIKQEPYHQTPASIKRKALVNTFWLSTNALNYVHKKFKINKVKIDDFFKKNQFLNIT